MRNLILAFAVFALVTNAAHAAPRLAQETIEDDINKELLDNELGPQPDDVPPAAEYPYPGAKEEGIITPDEAPKTALGPQAPRSIEPTPAPEPNLNIARPMKINEETGDYFYDTNVDKTIPAERSNGDKPLQVKDNGDYEYSKKLVPPAYIGREGIEKPVEIKANGEFKYAVENSPQTGNTSFRFGFFGPPAPALENDSTPKHTTFKDVYLKDQYPVLFVDYEFPLTQKIGRLGIHVGTGIFVASGNGQFAGTDPNRRADDVPLEKYTFFMLPNTLTAQYRFQYKDEQTLVPYVEGGVGYFTFAEFRDDNASPKIGGALTTEVAGGLNVLMDWLDRDAIRNLDTEYGINHVFLSLEARGIVGLNKSYDFTSTVFNAGFTLQF